MVLRLGLSSWAAMCVLAGTSFAGLPAGLRLDHDGNPGLAGPREIPPGNVGAGLRDAGVVVYSDQASFLAAVDSAVTETFETTPSSGLCDGVGVELLSFDDFVATSTPVALKLLREPCFGNHNTTPSGQKYLSADTDSADVSADVTFTFPESLAAFGLFLVDLDAASLIVQINDVDYEVPANGDGGESYFGITSPVAFDTVKFFVGVGGTDSHYSLDDVSSKLFPAAPSVSAPWNIEALPWGRVKASYRRTE